MIEATYFSKKLGRPILPELVAVNTQTKSETVPPNGAHAKINAKRRPGTP
jgi:hypothetical protein